MYQPKIGGDEVWGYRRETDTLVKGVLSGMDIQARCENEYPKLGKFYRIDYRVTYQYEYEDDGVLKKSTACEDVPFVAPTIEELKAVVTADNERLVNGIDVLASKFS